jgi:SAM-dependent methyltransferase
VKSDFDSTATTYHDDVQASIDFAGAEHDYYLRRKADSLVDLARRHLSDPGGLLLLDVGAGVGGLDTHLVEHFGTVISCDPSVGSTMQATRHVPTAGVLAAGGEALAIRDRTVDIAVAVNVMHHIAPGGRNSVVAEMIRVVRPGGLVAIFEHNPLNPLTRRSVANCPFDEGVELLGRREVRRRLRHPLLTEVERRYIIFTPFDVAWQHRVEARIGWLPLGAQHVVVARRT